jgi:hypothetical protein
MEWEKYDPQWLVDLAVQQAPAETWLHDALRACTNCLQWDEQTIYFVDRMEGKFLRNIVLVWPLKGKIVLDLLADGRIGALSFFVMAFGEDSFEPSH